MTPFQELELSEFAMVLILLIARKIVLEIARSPLVVFYVWSVISVLIEPHPQLPRPPPLLCRYTPPVGCQ